MDKGYIPIAPHLLYPQFLNDDDEQERELGLFFGNALMSKCAEVWVFGSRISSRDGSKNQTRQVEDYRLRYFTRRMSGGLTMYEVKENRRTPVTAQRSPLIPATSA